MRSISFLDYLLDEPGQAVLTLLHEKSSGVLLLLAAGMLGAFGAGIATHAFLRGKSTQFSWANLAARVGGLAWLLPVAAVFALYGFWMRPSLSNLGDPPATPATPVTVVRMMKRNSSLHSNPQEVSGVTYAPAPNAAPDSQTSAIATGTSLPEWVQDKEFITGNVRLAVVTGEIGATVEEAVANARKAAIDLVRVDFAATFPQVAGWRPPASVVANSAIRQTFVEEVDRKTVSSGTPFRVYRGYNQVELSPSVRTQIYPLWRTEVVDRRIWALGGLAGLLTLTFATLSAYFRLDARTAGLYRRRLKLAAVSVVAAGGLAAATLL
jgi:hypothetical protein